MVPGNLLDHPCSTKIRIFYPDDFSIRRAIVIIEGAHSHPTPPITKVSKDGKDQYLAAAEKEGIMGLTVAKLERGTIF